MMPLIGKLADGPPSSPAKTTFASKRFNLQLSVGIAFAYRRGGIVNDKLLDMERTKLVSKNSSRPIGPQGMR